MTLTFISSNFSFVSLSVSLKLELPAVNSIALVLEAFALTGNCFKKLESVQPPDAEMVSCGLIAVLLTIYLDFLTMVNHPVMLLS